MTRKAMNLLRGMGSTLVLAGACRPLRFEQYVEDDSEALARDWATTGLDISDTILNTLRVLTREECSLLALYYYDGLSFPEIADLLGMSPAQVRQLHRRLIERLRDYFSRGSAEPVT